MATFITILLFLLGIVLIVKGGDWFVDSSAAIAEASGIPKFIIGATIVSFATTLPELLVSVLASVEGKVDMAIGNAIGSVTANTGLILALSLICIPMMIKRSQIMKKAILLMVTIIGLILFTLDGALSAVECIFFLVLFGFFVYENVREALKKPTLENGEVEEKKVFSKQEWIKYIVFFVLGAAGIVFGSTLLVDNGSKLAELIGIPENIIALTMIAIGTSLPELVTAIVSIAKKQASMSVGNILGANIINCTLIMPICALIVGGSLPVTVQVLALDIPVTLALAFVIFVPAMIWKKLGRAQGIVAMSIYIAYLAVICFFNPF